MVLACPELQNLVERGSERSRVAQAKGPRRIRHDHVARPVAAADHGACPGAGDAQMGAVVGRSAAEAGAPDRPRPCCFGRWDGR